MNLRKKIKKNPFEPGFFLVTGKQGAGKTSFCSSLLADDYKKWRKYRVGLAKEVADEYYRENRIRLDITNRPYFSNIKILLDKKKQVYTHYVDVQKLGLPNPDFDVQYLPRGSIVYVQEADVMLFCRDYQELNEYLINLLKYVRHNELTIIFDCQVFGALDKAVRRLTMGIYYIVRSYDARFLFFWKVRKWKFLYVDNQLNEVLKELSAMGVRMKMSVVKRGRYKVFSNPFLRYNSHSGCRYFLKGIEKVGYQYKDHPKESLSVSDIDDFVSSHPLVRPEEYKKKRKKNQEPTENNASSA